MMLPLYSFITSPWIASNVCRTANAEKCKLIKSFKRVSGVVGVVPNSSVTAITATLMNLVAPALYYEDSHVSSTNPSHRDS